MELVYLWVEKYKNIEKQGFNFSLNFDVEFIPVYKDGNLSEESELKITPKENPLKDFFGKNINITAIVGENGSGKSSLLEQFNVSFGPKLSVILSNNQIQIYTYLKNLTVQNDTTISYTIIETRLPQVHFTWDILHYEPIVDYSTYFKVNPNILLKILGIFHHPEHIDLNSYQNSSVLKYLDIFTQKETNIFSFSPNKINIFFPMKKNQNEWDFERIKEKIEKLKFPKEDIGVKKEIYFRTISEFIEKHLHGGNVKKDFTLDEYNLLLSELEHMKEVLSIFPSFILDMYENDKSFFALSHGERSILLSNALIYEAIIKNKNQDILITLDEPDLSLHPEWQKKYVNELVKIFSQTTKNLHFLITSHSPFILSDLPKENVIFLEKGVQKHPFEDGQTFGANIHTLLSHGFFMSGGLMGEFAKEKIEEIKKFYELIHKLKARIDKNPNVKILATKYYEKRKDRFRNIQSIIGEPFLNTIMKNYLDELDILFYGKNPFLDKEIERLQALKDS